MADNMDREIKIKVCGMCHPDNILEVAKLQPDYMGFIFYKKTPRYVGDDFSVPEDFPSPTKRVGVFVNEENEVIMRKAQDHSLDLVQLHGNESVAQCAELKAEGLSVIKVFSVDENMDFKITQSFSGVVDYFLFDTKGRLYGGNAKRFDWNVLARYDQKIPFFLSGGITPENVGDVSYFRSLNIQAVDVNSGVELRPGLKDVNKVRAIKTILNSKQRYQ